jgi:sugar lactone lactonase YvrE
MLPLLALFVVATAAVVTQSAPAPVPGPLAGPAFALPAMTGLIEGIGYRPKTRAFYFGDVRLRCVWMRAADGAVTRFSAPDDRLLGVFRVAVDEANGALWASMGALEPMEGFAATHKGAGGLAELDLATGRVRRIVLAPADGAPHLLGDFVRLADGTLYATDTTSPVIWRLAPGAATLEPFVAGGFKSLQGITTTADGRGLFVTDYRVGVLHVDLATKAVRTLTAPPGADLRGLDTLLRTPDDALVAIFNATPRQRILRLTLDAATTAIAGIAVLAADPAMPDATLGTLVGDDLVFIADGGWNRFEPGKVDASPRPVPVLKVRWAGAR